MAANTTLFQTAHRLLMTGESTHAAAAAKCISMCLHASNVISHLCMMVKDLYQSASDCVYAIGTHLLGQMHGGLLVRMHRALSSSTPCICPSK